VKVGDLVKIPWIHHGLGVVVSTPRFEVNVLSPDGTTGKKLCDIFVDGKVRPFSCRDVRVVSESR
jgi:hypothetical protein